MSLLHFECSGFSFFKLLGTQGSHILLRSLAGCKFLGAGSTSNGSILLKIFYAEDINWFPIVEVFAVDRPVSLMSFSYNVKPIGFWCSCIGSSWCSSWWFCSLTRSFCSLCPSRMLFTRLIESCISATDQGNLWGISHANVLMLTLSLTLRLYQSSNAWTISIDLRVRFSSNTLKKDGLLSILSKSIRRGWCFTKNSWNLLILEILQSPMSCLSFSLSLDYRIVLLK